MTYIKFINLYKQNSLAKKKYYPSYFDNKTQTLLKKFIEIGLIKYAITSKKNPKIIYIYINYIKKNNNPFISISSLYKLNKNKNINLKTLILHKNFKFNSTLLLLTSKGVLTNFEAMQYKVGGVLLCQINY